MAKNRTAETQPETRARRASLFCKSIAGMAYSTPAFSTLSAADPARCAPAKAAKHQPDETLTPPVRVLKTTPG